MTFFLQPTEINSNDNYVCSNCWLKVETFHEFYLMISKIHHPSSGNTNTPIEKVSFNPSLISGCELVSTDAESLINLNNDLLKPCTPEFEMILIQNVPLLDDSETNQFDESHSFISSDSMTPSNEETLALVFLNNSANDTKTAIQNVIPTKKSQTWREKWYEKKKMKTNCPICGKK